AYVAEHAVVQAREFCSGATGAQFRLDRRSGYRDRCEKRDQLTRLWIGSILNLPCVVDEQGQVHLHLGFMRGIKRNGSSQVSVHEPWCCLAGRRALGAMLPPCWFSSALPALT